MLDAQHTTLLGLQRSISSALNERFAVPLWLSAEISDIKVNASGHCYLELVERGENDGATLAQARAVIWRSAYKAIADRFVEYTGASPERGLKILLRASVSYHEVYGLSLQIFDIDPVYTMGETERQRQLAIKKLKERGSWDLNRGLNLPQLLQRVAVISSATAAGYQDFMNELRASDYLIRTQLFEATMQGAAAEDSIIEAMIAVAERREEFDCLVVVRGGGSINDLSTFDDYRLALHFAHFPLPVISGIGHDKDVSVVDMVAHLSLKTPTAVASWLLERMMAIEGWLQTATIELQKYAVEIARRDELRFQSILSEIVTRTEQMMDNSKQSLVNSLSDLIDLSHKTLKDRRSQIDYMADVVDGFSPQKLLELGFAVARNKLSGRVLSSVEQLVEGEVLNIDFKDGNAEMEVKKLNKTEK